MIRSIVNFIIKNKPLKGSMTVELTYIMPVIFFVFLVVVYIGFYFHDKSIIQGLVYEASVVGTSNFRNNGEVNQEDITLFFQERGSIRLLFFPEPEIDITATETELRISAETRNGVMEMQVEKTFPLIEIENSIRKAMRIEETVEGAISTNEH